MLRFFARDLVSAAYAGILGRNADDEGLDAYRRELTATGNLPAVLGDLASSRESWERTLYERPEEIVRAVFLGLLDHEPEPEALASYSAELVQSRDLAALLAAVARSPEHGERILALRSEDLVRSAFRGLLDREPDPGAMAAYASLLADRKDLAEILAAIRRSPEHWDKLLAAHSRELVRSAFRALMDREPDANALDHYGTRLEQQRDLASVLTEIIGAPEYRAKICTALGPDIVRGIYQGLLGRDADPAGLEQYAAQMASPGDVGTILRSFVQSEEFVHRHRGRMDWPDPGDTYNDTALVYLHIQKTAGTVLQSMLLETFGEGRLFHEHADTLYLRSPGELCCYSVFAGHFNFDSLAYIPRRSLSLFTFVRRPKERLVSLYHFWRAHEASHAAYHAGMELADRMPMEEFFRADLIRRLPDTWNHMTWAIMGKRQWQEWQSSLDAMADERSQEEFLTSIVQPAVQSRLSEFLFIGIHEDFNRSAAMLFRLLDRPLPELRVEHSLPQLMASDPHFKQKIEKQPVTQEVDAALAGLVQLDTIVYEEAKKLYAERSALSVDGINQAYTGPPPVHEVHRHRQFLRSDGDTPLHAVRPNFGVTREEVIRAFRLVLGRNPENEETIRRHQDHASLEELGRTLVFSDECRSRLEGTREWTEPKWVLTPALDGLMMWVDLSDRYVSRGCLQNSWEPSETAFITSVLTAGDCFIDCGANIGWFTLLTAQRVGSTGLVIAFEPRADIFSRLQRSVAMNGYSDRCQLHQIALGDAHQQALLRVDRTSDNPGNTYLLAAGGRAFDPSPAGIRHETVTMLPLDHFMPDRTVTMIKIDVEGAEPLLIAGAARLITRDHPVILSEVYAEQLHAVSRSGAVEYFDALGSFGYVPYALNNGRLAAPVPKDQAARPVPYSVVFVHPDRHRSLLPGRGALRSTEERGR